MEISGWDGTLSPNDFCVAAAAFAERWTKHNSSASLPCSWVLPEKRPFFPSRQVEGYLALDKVPLLRSIEANPDTVNCTVEEDTGFNEKEDPIDTATLVQTSHQEDHYYDFHIVYSASYRVPVLFFRGYCSDGRPLQLNEIEEDLPACSTKVLLESKWTFITQEEHPYLNRPWYKLHPCGTSEWMKLLLLGDAAQAKNGVAFEQYLVSWFSVVGQVVGLKIPLEMVNYRSTLDQSELIMK